MTLIQSVMGTRTFGTGLFLVAPSLSVVVPAKAGTHTPCHGVVPRQGSNQNIGAYGPPPSGGRQSIGRSPPHPSPPKIPPRARPAREPRGRALERDAALLQAIDMRGRLERLHDV